MGTGKLDGLDAAGCAGAHAYWGADCELGGSLLALRGGGGALVEVSLVGREVYVSATGDLG